MNIEDLIRNLLQEILPIFEKKVVVFLSGGSVNAELLLKTLSEFQFNQCDIVMTDRAKAIFTQESMSKLNGTLINSHEELEKALNRADFILIPILTRNTLSKIALGIADNFVTTGIARAIMMKKEMIVVRDSFDANNSINIINNLSNNDAYNNMLHDYEKKLETFGVKIIDLSEFKVEVQKRMNPPVSGISYIEEQPIKEHPTKNENNNKELTIHSTILTLSDFKRLKDQKIINIKQGTIITPLARDFIQTNDITINSL